MVPSSMQVMLKSPSGPSPGVPNPHASGDSRWHCGVRRLKEGERKCHGEENLWKRQGMGGGKWLGEEGKDEYAFSFNAFPIQVSIFPFRSGHA